MTRQQMREAYLFYNELQEKNDIHFDFYTECSSTYDKPNELFMMWVPLSLDKFLDNFGQ